MLVGSNSVGKTSLVNRYTRNFFSNNYLNTIGCDIYVKNVTFHGDEYKLVIHDIGGQFEFREIRQRYMKDADIVMVVFALDEPKTHNIGGYIADVLALPTRPTWAIIGNKVDRIETGKPDLSRVDTLAAEHNVPLYITSAKTNTNVQYAFLDLVKKRVEDGASSTES